MSGRYYAGNGGLRGNRNGIRMDAHRAKFTILHVAGSGWIVLDPEGAKCGGPFGAKDAALTTRDNLQARADRNAKRGARPCMCYGEVFESQGIHNRLCDICKRRGQEGSPHAMVLPRRRTS